MLTPQTSDTLHRAWLYRLLSAVADDRTLMRVLRFKGGTCAALRGFLHRFSVDLDFDLIAGADSSSVRRSLERVFETLGLTIKDQSRKTPQYFLRYPSRHGKRNTIELDITDPPPRSNTYETVRLADIDRFVPCHTVETMVANKFVTPLDRFAKNGSIAGRDIYDIHSFLMQDLPFAQSVIEERTGYAPAEFFDVLISFIDRRVTQTVIDQDLNTLLPPVEFQRVRTVLKAETVRLLRERTPDRSA